MPPCVPSTEQPSWVPSAKPSFFWDSPVLLGGTSTLGGSLCQKGWPRRTQTVPEESQANRALGAQVSEQTLRRETAVWGVTLAQRVLAFVLVFSRLR